VRAWGSREGRGWPDHRGRLTQGSLDAHQSDADDRTQVLAVNRVTTVRNELIRLGASPDRITVGSYGRQVPVCATTTDNAWS